MKALRGKWYIWLFPAAVGFAAGAAIELGGGYVDSSIAALGQVDGITLLSLALTGMLFDGALIAWCSIGSGAIGKAMAAGALWVKAVLMGLLCRDLTLGFSAIKALLMLLTVLGGGCVCVACLMERNEKQAKARRVAVWMCGAAVECIIIPSIVRTWSLLFN